MAHSLKIIVIAAIFAVCGCASKPKAGYVVATSEEAEVLWVAGIRDLKANLGIAGSCPTPEIYAYEVPIEQGIGFGVCFIPKLKGFHATAGVRYEITLPGEGVVSPVTNERVKQVSGYSSCFNGRPCFGGYIPSEYEFIAGEWKFEFFKIDRKLIEFTFIVKAHE